MLYFLLFFTQLNASLTQVMSKDLTSAMHPALILLIRGMIASVFYLVWLGIFRRHKLFSIEKKDIPIVIFLGILSVPINQFMLKIALSLTSAPNVSLIYSLIPVFVLIIAYYWLKEPVTWKKAVGISISLAGTFMLILEDGLDIASDSFTGNIIIVIASISLAIYTVIGKPMARKYGAVYITAIAMLTGYLIYLPVFFLLQIDINLSAVETGHWLELIYLGIFSSCVGYIIWYYALTKIDAGKVAVFNNLQPFITTALAILFLDFYLSIYFIFSGIIIIAGIALTQRG